MSDLLITLGDVSVQAGASFLDGQPVPADLECPDYPEVAATADHLHEAVKAATCGGFMDTKAHPYCERCGADPAITLGDLTLDVAQRLVQALQTAYRPVDLPL
ncbi:hypothetical protein ACFYOD_37050 [Streptomyces sp. NPDC006703]|uniref:hypothetical protein n=1 Tax=Streptomyces sp. NPDC006703 TaxID=3364759 RepID=UPI00369A3AAD